MDTPPPPGPLASLRATLAGLTDALRLRLQLAATEAGEQALLAAHSLLWALAALFLALLGLALLLALALVALWDSHRLLALGGAALLCLGAAALAAAMARRMHRRRGPLLAATLEELERDASALGRQP